MAGSSLVPPPAKLYTTVRMPTLSSTQTLGSKLSCAGAGNRRAIVAGVAEVPKLVLAFRDTMWPLGTGTSPFDELPELYRFVRLPLSDSADPPDDVAVYEVDRRIEGAEIVPPIVSGT